MRIAIFFTPPPDHPLTRAAALWLGRDAFSGEEFAQAGVDGFTRREIRELTASPRRYGFHATLQAPFRLAAGKNLDDAEEALDAVSRSLRPVSLGHIRVERLKSFFALTPTQPIEAVNELAGDIIRRFDPYRAPPIAEEIERRQPHKLSLRQRGNLERWGYPYVFHDFRFHMTLTGSVPEDRRSGVQSLLEKRFSPVLGEPVTIDALALFVESTPPGDFLVHKTVPLSPALQPMDAE